MIESTLITASAGSGKTYTLTTSLLKLILSEAITLDKVLVTTFTKKAAQEIYSRLIQRLLNALSSQKELENLIKSTQLSDITEDSVKKSLINLLKSQSYLKIQTLDSFFISIGQLFPFELNLPLGWKISDPWEIDQIKVEAIDKIILNLGIEKFGLILPLAFRDSLANQIFKALSNELDKLSKDIIFSNDETWNFHFKNHKLQNLDFSFSTIESICESELHVKKLSNQQLSGIRKLYENYNEEKWEEVLGNSLAVTIFKEDYHYYKKDLPESIRPYLRELVLSAINNLGNSLKLQSIGIGAIFTEYLKNKNALNKERGILSFQDLTALLASNSENLEIKDVYYRLDAKLDLIYIDEFQDTSSLQWMILKPIIEEIMQDSSKSRIFSAVGDAKQAIYGWRGGLKNIFDHVKQSFPEISEIPLSTSYRSKKNIINFVNQIFTKPFLPSKYEDISNAWQREFIEHESLPQNEGGKVKIIGVKSCKSTKEVNIEKLELIKEAIVNGNPNSTIGILTRTNKESLLIESYLKSFNISASTVSSNYLKSFYETQLVISFLTLAIHPDDELSYQQIISVETEYSDFSRQNLSRTLLNLIYDKGISNFVIKVINILRVKFNNPSAFERISSLAAGIERKRGNDINFLINAINGSYFENDDIAQVSILTIHKSKGLEFDHVILPFSSSSFTSQRDTTILKKVNDSFSPPTSVLKSCSSKSRAFFPELEEMANEITKTKISESLCLAYVAVTRAKSELTILIDQKDKYDPEKDLSLRSLIVNSLNLSFKPEENIILLETGSSPKTNANTSENSRKEHTLKLPKINIPDFALKKNLPIVYPSKEIDTSRDVLLKSNNTNLLKLGTELHEILKNFTKPLYSHEELNSHWNELKSISTLSDEALKILNNFIDSPAANSILYFDKSNEIIKILTEYPIRKILNNNIINARLDRLVIRYSASTINSISIIDFKLKNSDSGLYQGQLNYYKELISSKFGIDKEKINTYLVSLIS